MKVRGAYIYKVVIMCSKLPVSDPKWYAPPLMSSFKRAKGPRRTAGIAPGKQDARFAKIAGQFAERVIYTKPLPLRLGWRQHWLVLLEQPVHLQVRPALAAAFTPAPPSVL